MNWLKKTWLAIAIWWESLWEDDDDDKGGGTPINPAAVYLMIGVAL